jgi:hypothetical protein
MPNTLTVEEQLALFDSMGLPRPTIIEPRPYEAAVMASAEQLIASKARPMVRVFYAGEQIAEVYETVHGAFWASVYEFVATRDIHPVDEHYVSMIVGDRHRWDRIGDDGMPRSLRAAMDLLEWPDPPYPPRLLGTGPSGGLHEFALADVLGEVRLARSNRRTQRWDVDRRPGSTISRMPT